MPQTILTKPITVSYGLSREQPIQEDLWPGEVLFVHLLEIQSKYLRRPPHMAVFLQSQAIWQLLMETCQESHRDTGERRERGGQKMWQNLAPPSQCARVACPTCQCCGTSQYFYADAGKTQTRSSLSWYECMVTWSERYRILYSVFMGHDIIGGV